MGTILVRDPQLRPANTALRLLAEPQHECRRRVVARLFLALVRRLASFLVRLSVRLFVCGRSAGFVEASVDVASFCGVRVWQESALDLHVVE